MGKNCARNLFPRDRHYVNDLILKARQRFQTIWHLTVQNMYKTYLISIMILSFPHVHGEANQFCLESRKGRTSAKPFLGKGYQTTFHGQLRPESF